MKKILVILMILSVLFLCACRFSGEVSIDESNNSSEADNTVTTVGDETEDQDDNTTEDQGDDVADTTKGSDDEWELPIDVEDPEIDVIGGGETSEPNQTGETEPETTKKPTEPNEEDTTAGKDPEVETTTESNSNQDAPVVTEPTTKPNDEPAQQETTKPVNHSGGIELPFIPG